MSDLGFRVPGRIVVYRFLLQVRFISDALRGAGILI